MLSFDVSVPEFGEAVSIWTGRPIVADGQSVAVTILEDDAPMTAFLVPAQDALTLSREIWKAARQADPQNTSLIAQLRASFAGNA